MIQLMMAGIDLEQDIKPLIKAFYKEEQILAYVNADVPCGQIGTGDIIIRMELLPERFVLSFMENAEIPVFLTAAENADALERKEYRNQLARAIFRLLQEHTGMTLPWGTLVGVRPVKIIYEMLRKNVSDADIINYMEMQYYCSREKVQKGITIARREIEILDNLEIENGYSLYIGIPFCPTTCAYCSFASYPMDRYQEFTEPYLKALFQEMDGAKAFLSGKKLTTVYIGGGTPASLSEEQLGRLFSKLHAVFPIEEAVEFTFEAGRPDCLTEEKLRIIKQAGVTRISINPQSMREETLKLIGRKHTAAQIEEAFHMARRTGHENINMDLIIGLPGESPADTAYTLERIGCLMPDALTVHTLAVKRAARLNTHKEQYTRHTASGIDEMYQRMEAFTKENAYLPYYLYRQKNMSNNLENIGYARYGKECFYNIIMMEEKQSILALGAAAASKYVSPDGERIERVENVKSLTDYISRIKEMIQRKTNFFIA